MLLSRFFSPFLCAAGLCLVTALHAQQVRSSDAEIERALRHATPEWQLVADHLPDPVTASESSLEIQGDVLQARRMPEDALEYYAYALKRGGGDQARIFRHMGVSQLQLHRPELARACFRRAIELKKKDAEAWNNLGASEFMVRDVKSSIPDYKHAIKINKKNPIYHANLGTAYFELRSYEDAREQFAIASKLDPDVFRRGGWGGTQVEVLSTQERGRFCFEMATLAARTRNDVATLEWLGKAAEAGFDVKTALRGERDFDGYRKDPRIALLLSNARAMRGKQVAVSEAIPTLPALGGSTQR